MRISPSLTLFFLSPLRIYLNRPEDPGLNIGSHAKPVSCMEFSRELGALVTGGWDGHVHIW
jgi:WD40 repeat protein